MYKNRSRGFTLIELLVVIAIIGILSAVVLASLSTARNKGSDAAIQSDLSTVQTQAEIYFGGVGANTYGTAGTATGNGASATCSALANMLADGNIKAALAGADVANGTGFVTCNVITSPSAGYAVQVQLINNATTYWCVDSSGISRQSGTATTPGTQLTSASTGAAAAQCP